jgi:hypothetical protein
MIILILCTDHTIFLAQNTCDACSYTVHRNIAIAIRHAISHPVTTKYFNAMKSNHIMQPLRTRMQQHNKCSLILYYKSKFYSFSTVSSPSKFRPSFSVSNVNRKILIYFKTKRNIYEACILIQPINKKISLYI